MMFKTHNGHRRHVYELSAPSSLGSLVLRLDETRTRPIKVVPKHEIQVGVSYWNDARRPIKVRQFILESFHLGDGKLRLKCIFNNSKAAI